MPRRAARPCAHPGCPNLVRGRGVRYCPEHLALHRREQDARRGTPAERGYNATWRRIRARVLREAPVCQECGKRASELVHHRDGDASNNSASNLIALCSRCHAKIHARRGDLFGGRARSDE